MDRSQEIHSCHVCVNLSCAEGGSETVRAMLAEKLADSEVAVKTQICFGACRMGPNVVLHPEGTWYSNVQPGDVDEIVAHIQGGAPVERLMNTSDKQLHELVISILDAGLD